jgi:hypothetical protein
MYFGGDGGEHAGEFEYCQVGEYGDGAGGWIAGVYADVEQFGSDSGGECDGEGSDAGRVGDYGDYRG